MGIEKGRWVVAVLAIVAGVSAVVAPSPAAAVPERMRASPVKAALHRLPPEPTGRLVVVKGNPKSSGSGAPVRFLVEIEQGLRVEGPAFAAAVQRVLYDKRSWGGGTVAFRRVDSEPVRFRVALTSPATTDRLCAPLLTVGIYSCHQDGRAVLNSMRWHRGAASYGDDLLGYRRYLVNHEVGHALGSYHRSCPAAGATAPVMLQQTMGVAPCRPGPWPSEAERQGIF